MCRLSWNLGASTSWNAQGLSRSVMGLLYLFFRLSVPDAICSTKVFIFFLNFHLFLWPIRKRGSSFGTETILQDDRPESQGGIFCKYRDFSHCHNVCTGSGAHPTTSPTFQRAVEGFTRGVKFRISKWAKFPFQSRIPPHKAVFVKKDKFVFTLLPTIRSIF